MSGWVALGLGDRVVVAGGGGSAGNGATYTTGSGGAGGGLTSAQAGRSAEPGRPGAAVAVVQARAAPARAGGGASGGGSQPGGSGASGSGGAGGSGDWGAVGGGGGDGYYGGGGGGAGAYPYSNGGGGGGGSDYVEGSATLEHDVPGYNYGPGEVTLTWGGGAGSTGLVAANTYGGGNLSGHYEPQCIYGIYPVNCATGDFYHTFTDLAVPGRGLPLDLARTYNSGAASDRRAFSVTAGRCSYCMSLSVDGGRGRHHNPGGRGPHNLCPQRFGRVSTPPGAVATLVEVWDHLDLHPHGHPNLGSPLGRAPITSESGPRTAIPPR